MVALGGVAVAAGRGCPLRSGWGVRYPVTRAVAGDCGAVSHVPGDVGDAGGGGDGVAACGGAAGDGSSGVFVGVLGPHPHGIADESHGLR